MIRAKWEVTEDYKKRCSRLLMENLAPLRAKSGLTQEELANIAGISRQTYYVLENGKRELSWCTCMALFFLFDSIDSTAKMMRELKVFPQEMVDQFNAKETQGGGGA